MNQNFPDPIGRAIPRRRLLQLGAAALPASYIPNGFAQADTASPVRILAGFPAGSPVEAAPRALIEAIRQTSGRTYVIDNRPGAGGNIAASEVAKARPDGRTILYITGGHTTAAALYRKLAFDPVSDFTPVTQLVAAPGFALLVRNDSPYKDIEQLLSVARSKPNSISYASLGVGNTTHLLAELFSRAVGAKFIHAPYRTSPIPDILGGHVDFTWLGTSISAQLVAKKQARVLAVSSKNRMREAPQAPTFDEMGISEVDVPAWSGFLAPAHLPPSELTRLHEELVAASKHKVFTDYVKGSGEQRIVMSPPADFAAYMASETARYRRILAPLGIQLD